MGFPGGASGGCVCVCVCVCMHTYMGFPGGASVCVCVCVCTHHILIHSSSDGPLGCFHVLAVVDSAAMNTGAGCMHLLNYTFVQIYAQE